MPKNNIMTLITIAIAVVIIAALLALLAANKNQHLKARARECAKEALRFHDKLQQLSDPSHFFTDEELRQLKKEFAPLLEEVNELYESAYISKDFLDEIGLKDFMRERKFLNHIQSQNNQLHK